MDVVTGRNGFGQVAQRSEFYKTYLRMRRREPAYCQTKNATWVSLHGGSFVINDDEIDECRQALARDLVNGAKIPSRNGKLVDPAFSELKRLPHKIAPAVFDFDPVLINRRLAIDDMVAVARDSILPTLRVAYGGDSWTPGKPALIVMMAARRNADGTITEVYKETIHMKCGRCGAEKKVPSEHAGYVVTCDECGCAFDVDTCTCLDSSVPPARKIVHVKSGAHFRVPCDAGPYVSTEQSKLLVSYADSLLKRSTIVPVEEANFDVSVCSGSGLRVAYCPKVKLCDWCDGESAKQRKVGGEIKDVCSMCGGSGKITDWRTYWPVAVLDINGKLVDGELKLLQDGQRGIYRTLCRTSMRPPANVTAPSPGFRESELRDANPTMLEDPPEGLQDALLFAVPSSKDRKREENLLESASKYMSRKRKREQPSIRGKKKGILLDPRGAVAKLTLAEIVAYSKVYERCVIKKFERYDNNTACAYLTSFGAKCCANAKRKAGHKSREVFFVFKYTAAKGAQMQQRCLSDSLGHTGLPCHKFCPKHNEWRTLVSSELASKLFPAVSKCPMTPASLTSANSESLSFKDQWRVGLSRLYELCGDMDWVTVGF